MIYSTRFMFIIIFVNVYKYIIKKANIKNLDFKRNDGSR